MSRVLPSPFQLLELNVISGQDLAQVSRKMRTYAVAWVHPDRKLSTRVDNRAHNNPTWNDKFVFRVDDDFLYAETSAIMIEIYAVHWFRDIHVGTVRVIVGNLIPPAHLPRHHQQHGVQLGMRFVALQVRRPSGRPQGILNIGVALLDSSRRSMPLYSQNASAVGYRHLMGEKDNNNKNINHHHNNKEGKDDKNSDNQNQLLLPWNPMPELRRAKSETSSMIGGSDIITSKMRNQSSNIFKKQGSTAASSIALGSDIFKKGITNKQGKLDYAPGGRFAFGGLTNAKYGSDISGGTPNNNKVKKVKPSNDDPFLKINRPPFITDSELGPSASEVVAAMVKNKYQYRVEDTESEIMGSWSLESSMEGLQSKLERWRAELPPVYDRSDSSGFGMGGGKRVDKHNRRRSEGDGLFSCFGTFCGIECSIICCGPSARKKSGWVKRSPSVDNLSFI